MKSILWFRITSVLLFLYALGHVFRFFVRDPETPESRSVWSSMNHTRLSRDQSSATFADLYRSSAILVAALLFFEAFLAWHCSHLVGEYITDAIILGWCILLFQILDLVLSWRYFGIVQVVLSLVTGTCTGIALALVTPASSF